MARTAYRCIDCLQSFECVQRTNALDVVVGNFGPYSRVGVKR